MPFLRDCLSQEHRCCLEAQHTLHRLAFAVAYTDTGAEHSSRGCTSSKIRIVICSAVAFLHDFGVLRDFACRPEGQENWPSNQGFVSASSPSKWTPTLGQQWLIEAVNRPIDLHGCSTSVMHVIQAVPFNQWYGFWAVYRPQSRCVRFLYFSRG